MSTLKAPNSVELIETTLRLLESIPGRDIEIGLLTATLRLVTQHFNLHVLTIEEETAMYAICAEACALVKNQFVV